MEFVTAISPDEFNTFVENHPTKSHFLQSPYWGEVSRYRRLTPHYLGVRENGRLVAAAMLLEKKLPFGYCHFYAPRGFVLDYSNDHILEFFTRHVSKYVKTRKVLYFKIDPDIKLHQIDKDARPVKDCENNYRLVQKLKSLGYRHFGYNKNFEASQPRYTFRIKTDDRWPEIEKRFSASTRQRIRKAMQYGVEVKIGTAEDVKTFYQLMAATERRKNIFQHEYAFYTHFYDIFNKGGHVKLFLGRVYPAKIVKKIESELARCHEDLAKLQQKAAAGSSRHLLKQLEQLNKQIAKLQENKQLFTAYRDKYPEGVTVTAQMIVFYGDKGWVLYAGNHDDLTETFANYLVYCEHIKYAHEHGIKYYDQFGTVGDLRQDNPLLGLHEFKKKFGGEYTEFIGEFTYVTNSPLYFVFTVLVPFYRKIVNLLLRRRKKDEV